MTRRDSLKDLEKRLDALEGDAPESDDERFVIAIGGDPDVPAGWVTQEEFEAYHADDVDADVLEIPLRGWTP